MAKKSLHHYFEAIGRRKTSTARVRLYPTSKGKEISVGSLKMKLGDIFVNGKPMSVAFGRPAQKIRFQHPLELTENREKFAISIVVKGGGQTGQLDAIIHGLSRAIEKANKEDRAVLKKEGLMTRDPRKRERRKVGTGGKARRQKQSPKR